MIFIIFCFIFLLHGKIINLLCPQMLDE